MQTRILWLTLVGGTLIHSTAFAQNQQSIKIAQTPALVTVTSFGPQNNGKINPTDYTLPDTLYGLKKVTPVDYFFDIKKPNCSNKVCFGFVPIPAVYYQSENKNKEFFLATSGTSIGVRFRYRF